MVFRDLLKRMHISLESQRLERKTTVNVSKLNFTDVRNQTEAFVNIAILSVRYFVGSLFCRFAILSVHRLEEALTSFVKVGSRNEVVRKATKTECEVGFLQIELRCTSRIAIQPNPGGRKRNECHSKDDKFLQSD
ncbi:hypothetical protein RF11_12956 [Thelohanellus kitauei]|uniref:Uncharacterized protein n=1 Tax=Thelohanellus kitauei TaxID=669202 RepID=A0A0C2N2V1_THEKT|nr:hypothetical protein RF11_12956 [Thelohanellus kitauei]